MLSAPQIYLQPTKIENQHFGFHRQFWLELKIMQMKNQCLSTFLISSVFISSNQCTKILYLHSQSHGLLQCIALSWSELTKIRDNNNNVHFFSLRFVWALIFHQIAPGLFGPCFTRTANDKIWDRKLMKLTPSK